MATIAKKKEESKENLMYIGPTISGVARYSTVYKDGILPDKLKKCVESFPAMKKLLVKIDDMPEAVKKLNEEHSTLKTIYTQTRNRFKEVR